MRRRASQSHLRRILARLDSPRTAAELRAGTREFAAVAFAETEHALKLYRRFLALYLADEVRHTGRPREFGFAHIVVTIARLLPTSKCQPLRKALRQRAADTGRPDLEVRCDVVMAALAQLGALPAEVQRAGRPFSVAWVIEQVVRIAKADLLDQPMPAVPAGLARERRSADALTGAEPADDVRLGAHALDAFCAAEAAADRTRALAALLERCTPQQRRYLALRQEGYSNRGACAQLGVTEAAGSGLYGRIRARAAAM